MLGLDTDFLAQRLQCSRTDKQECLEIVQQLLELSFFAREHNFVELDKMLHMETIKYSDPFLNKAVSCLVDLSDYDLVREVLRNYILTGNYNGQQFLKSVVISETILALHKRTDVDHIFSFLIPSLFGMDYERDIVNMYKNYTRQRGYRLSAEDELSEEDDSFELDESF